jgi:hypothetical protein
VGDPTTDLLAVAMSRQWRNAEIAQVLTLSDAYGEVFERLDPLAKKKRIQPLLKPAVPREPERERGGFPFTSVV